MRFLLYIQVFLFVFCFEKKNNKLWRWCWKDKDVDIAEKNDDDGDGEEVKKEKDIQILLWLRWDSGGGLKKEVYYWNINTVLFKTIYSLLSLSEKKLCFTLQLKIFRWQNA